MQSGAHCKCLLPTVRYCSRALLLWLAGMELVPCMCMVALLYDSHDVFTTWLGIRCGLDNELTAIAHARVNVVV